MVLSEVKVRKEPLEPHHVSINTTTATCQHHPHTAFTGSDIVDGCHINFITATAHACCQRCHAVNGMASIQIFIIGAFFYVHQHPLVHYPCIKLQLSTWLVVVSASITRLNECPMSRCCDGTGCVAWTWHSTDAANCPGACYLKSKPSGHVTMLVSAVLFSQTVPRFQCVCCFF